MKINTKRYSRIVILIISIAASGFAQVPPPQEIIFARFYRSGGPIPVGILSMRPDGTGLTVHTVGDATDPEYSVDYCRPIQKFVMGTGSGVWTMDLNGTRTFLTNTDVSWGAKPVWSPDCSKIAFHDRIGPNNWAVFTINSDGTGRTQLVFPNPPELLSSFNPSWSRDGSKLAFGGRVHVGGVITNHPWVINADGTGQTDLTPTSSSYLLNGALDWSPDNSTIIFGGSFGDEGDIATVPAKGGEIVRLGLTPAVWQVLDPTFSPDGSKIAYFYYDGIDPYEIWTANSNGTSPVRLTTGFLDFPRWIRDSSPAATVSVGGIVVAHHGRPINNATLNLDDGAGQIFSARSNPFGWFQFHGVQIGATYTLTARAKGHEFSAQEIIVSGPVAGLVITSDAGKFEVPWFQRYGYEEEGSKDRQSDRFPRFGMVALDR